MSMRVLGIGGALPPRSISQKDAAEWALATMTLGERLARTLPVLYRRASVHRRGSVLLESRDGEEPASSFFRAAAHPGDRGPTTGERLDRFALEAPALASAACRRALGEAGLDPGRVTHIITVSCTGFAAPGVDQGVIAEVGLSPAIARTTIGFMGCHGAINALRTAQAFARADPDARVLICAVELCTLHFHYAPDAQRAVANALFADGAAALIGAADTPDGPAAGWRLARTASCILPDSADAMTWRIGDHGFEMTLSARVPSLIEAHLPRWLGAWLAEQGMSVPEIRSWAIHPGGPRIVGTAAAALGLAPGATEASDHILSECGNMSSPTVLFILERLRARGARTPCVALAFGPGLALEAALFV